MQKPIFIPYAHIPIKNIIFDLGGVIMNISYQKTLNEFKKIGITNIEELYTQAAQVELFDKFDKGLISPQEFRDEIRKRTSARLSDQIIDNAWNAMFLDLPKVRLDLLQRVKNHYNTFLLSNTNAIHIDYFNQLLNREFGLKDFSIFFHKIYYSYEIKMRKPDPDPFMLIVNENGLKPEETLFIDDSVQHIEGARQLGLMAHLLNVKEGDSIETLFRRE
jgi:putative hydrolase of the HAD superfamily